MSKNIVIVIVVVLVLGGAGFAVMSNKKVVAPTSTPVTSETEQKIPDEGTDIKTEKLESRSAQINIKDSAYFKPELIVKKGTKVTWVNQDGINHTVTSDEESPAGGPNSESLSSDQTYSFTFNVVGTFSYHCDFHSGMKGIITVTD